MVLRSDMLQAFQESRLAVGKRVDPAAWHEERARKALTRQYEGFQLGGRRPEWFEEWFAGKKAEKAATGSLSSYLYDLTKFNQDPAQLSTKEIISRLATLSSQVSKTRYRRICIVIRMIVKQIRGKDEAEKLPLPAHGDPRLTVFSKEEIQKMLSACDNPRDRLMIEFLTELGNRRGELNNLKIKDIAFDQHSPIVWLRGKTGERRRRIYVSTPDLQAYLNSHPHRDNPNAALWVNYMNGEPIQYEGFYKIISKIGWRALNRQIYPHMFRHTSATADAKKYTDSEMMIRHGWHSASQVRVYAHLSNRDVDDKDLLLHGLKPANEAQEPLIETRHCPHCQAENAPVAIYCQKCCKPLTQIQNPDQIKNMQQQINELNLAVRMLQDASGLKVVQHA